MLAVVHDVVKAEVAVQDDCQGPGGLRGGENIPGRTPPLLKLEVVTVETRNVFDELREFLECQ